MNLNNVSHIEEKQVCDIFDSLRKNRNLTRLSVVNCDVSSKILCIYKNISIRVRVSVPCNLCNVQVSSLTMSVVVLRVVYFNWVKRSQN